MLLLLEGFPQEQAKLILKGILSSHKSVTVILPYNPSMLPSFSFCMNFHPILSDSCAGPLIRL